MSTIGSLFVSIGVNTKELEAGLAKAGKIATGFAAVGLAAATTAIVAFGKAAVEASLDFNKGMVAISTLTGATGRELEGMGAIVKNVYANNWGQSMEDVGRTLANVNQVLGLQGDALEEATTKALIFRDVLGVDVNESLRAVRSAVETFGITNTQVFDQMAATIQRVGDPAGDLADTVNEYSSIFAGAGFSAEQMFAILETGVGEGARNFDQVADAVKEFSIRIIDGSDLTKDSMEKLFRATSDVGAEYYRLEDIIAINTDSLKANNEALANAEGKYNELQAVMGKLESRLNEARRLLDELARPNLAGMEAFDDKLFDLGQQAKQLKLELLGTEEGSDAFEALEKQLDRVNKEIEKVTLKQDLTYDQQFRDLEKAAKAGTVEVKNFDEAMADIANQKDVISQLEGAITAHAGLVHDAAVEVDFWTENGRMLEEGLAEQKATLETMQSPAQQFFEALSTGSMTGAEAMSQVIQMLAQVDDKLLQNQIGVALFGTKWEDIGPQIMLTLDPLNQAMEDTAGTVDAINKAASGESLSGFAALWRGVQTAIEPIGAALIELAEESLPTLQEFLTKATPIIQEFAVVFADTLSKALPIVGDALVRIGEVLGIGGENASGMDMALGLLTGTLDLIVTAVEAAAIAFQLMADAIEGVKSGVSFLDSDSTNLVGKLGQLSGTVSGFSALAQNYEQIGTVIKGVGKLSATVSGFSGIYQGAKGLYGYAEGGVVPGPKGAAQLAMVHGGETIIPAGQGMGRVNNIYIDGLNVGSNQGGIDEALQLMVATLRGRLAAAT